MRSLKRSLGLWFTAALFTLYAAVATAVWLLAVVEARRDVVMSIHAETEAASTYYATLGRLDPPEIAAPEQNPVAVWVRIVEHGEVLAATPGAPAPEDHAGATPSAASLVTRWRGTDGLHYVTLREPVAGKPSAYVDGTASLAAVTRVANIVGLSLLIVGLLLLPCAVVGGRWLVQRGLRPLDDLVRGVRTLDHSQLTERLRVDESAPVEVLALAREFDSLLTRVQGTIEGMRRFTADASHELRNPLAVLRAGLEVTLRRPRTLEEYERSARQTLSELERVQATVESLLALAHQTPGEEPEIDHRPVDVGELLQSVPAAFALPVADRGISFAVSVEPGLRVMGDATLLRLLLFNLLDNAVRHSPDGEVITIEAGSEENEVRLRVLDRGPGVSPEAREHIFRRSAGARTPEGRIGGLGLSFARWVAERHGGALTLDAAGAGASFSLVLPAGFSRAPAVRSS